MDLVRKGSQIIIDLDKEQDALGLYAVMSGQPQTVSPEVFAHGQQLYQWLFTSVHKLAQNHGIEKSPITMSAETMAFQAFQQPVSRRSKKR